MSLNLANYKHQYFKPMQLEFNFSSEKMNNFSIMEIWNEMQESEPQLAITSRSKQIHMLGPWKDLSLFHYSFPPPTLHQLLNTTANSILILNQLAFFSALSWGLGTAPVLMRFSSSIPERKHYCSYFHAEQLVRCDWLTLAAFKLELHKLTHSKKKEISMQHLGLLFTQKHID